MLTLCASNAVAETISFNRDIRPILSDNCYKCHGPGVRKPKGDLQLHVRTSVTSARGTRPPAIRPGKATASPLIQRVQSTDPDEKMPPPTTGKKLSASQVNLLKQWVDSGAAYEKHWAFTPPQRAAVRDGVHPIDRFVIKRLESEDLRPAPRADRRTLIRRLSLDLTGLPPDVLEVEAFLHDRRKAAYEQLVNRLLASPHYGERMAQEWMDAARYADTTGFAADQPRTMWHYRDWIIQAFNTNMPFDQFTIEQLAGDMLPNATQSQKIATGFHRNSMQALGNNPPKEEFRVKGIVDRLDTTGRVWLGLTLACAECHDHKFDPISQKEYYQLFAIFNNIPHHGKAFGVHGPRMLVMPEMPKATKRTADAIRQFAALRAKLQGQINPSRNAARGIAHWPFDGQVTDRTIRPAPLKRPDLKFTFSKDGPVANTRSLLLKRGQFLHMAASKKLNIHGRFAISAWIKTRSAVADIVSKYDWKSGQRAFVFGLGGEGEKSGRSGHLFAWVSATAGRWQGVEIHGSRPLHDGQWHHVAFVFEPGRQVRLLVDGVVDAGARIVGNVPPAVSTSTRDFVIGAGYRRSQKPNAFFYDGLIANLRIDAKLDWEGRKEIKQIHDTMASLPPLAPPAQPAPAKLTMKGPMTAQVMVEMDTPRETYIHIRGNFENRGHRVSPDVPEFLGGLSPGVKADRLGFAQWLVDGKNPLVARVIVNRLWQQFFGSGLVRTVEDFGNQGEWPSHPELLDWLAVEFVESGWDVRHMVRLIVTSQTYQQSSKMQKHLLARDLYNRLLARAPRYRLPAEQIRDNMLTISGLLHRKIGGPSVYPVQPSHIGEFRDKTAGTWKTSHGNDRYRRGIYTFWQRMYPYPSLILFDAPARERSCIRRSRSNTPLQALVLLNDPVFFEAAQAFGGRILSQSGARTDAARIEYAFLVSLARPPDQEESKMFLAFVQNQRTRFAGSPRTADSVVAGRRPAHAAFPAVELAAWTMVASTLLALDETNSKP